MSINIAAMLAVLRDARVLLAQPDNDFSWSSFDDAEAALREIDKLSAGIRNGDSVPLDLRVLFAPTGPIQEVSLSSGWGEKFLGLAERFDAALTGADAV
jgi:hypothetical protein